MTFELPLKDERVKPHQITALHLIVSLTIIGSSALMLAVHYLIGQALMREIADATKVKPHSDTEWYAALGLLFLGILLMLASLFKNKWLTQKGINRTVRIGELMVILVMASYAAMNDILIAAIMFGILGIALLFAIFWENNNDAKNAISIADDGIKLPIAARRRNIYWHEVDNVIYKYNTLTVNTLDGRMYQWTIKKNDTDKEAFATFCFAQIKAAEKNRSKGDW